MATITLHNLPSRLLDRLTRQAELSHRSLDNEIIACIERAINPKSKDRETVLKQIRELRTRTGTFNLTDEELEQAIHAGRI